jgi:DNA-binding transcriptional LysR family regulator
LRRFRNDFLRLLELCFEICGFLDGTCNRSLVARRNIELAKLVDEPWLLPLPNTLPRSILRIAFHASGLKSPGAGVMSLTFNLYSSLLRTGRYLTVLPG